MSTHNTRIETMKELELAYRIWLLVKFIKKPHRLDRDIVFAIATKILRSKK